MEDSTSLSSSWGDLYEMRTLKTAGLELLKHALAQSPPSRELITVSDRLSVVASSDTELHYYSAPSSPVQPETQEPEESTKSKKNPDDMSTECQYTTAPSSPEKTNPIKIPEESLTEPTKPRKKGKSMSPKLQYATAPSSPTVCKSKSRPESPQELENESAKLQPPSPKLAAASSFESLAVPDSESEFVLYVYDRRVTKQLAFMAAVLELQNTIETKEGLKDLISQQRWFEKQWSPPPQRKTKPGDKGKDDTKYSLPPPPQRHKTKPGDKVKDDTKYSTPSPQRRKTKPGDKVKDDSTPSPQRRKTKPGDKVKDGTKYFVARTVTEKREMKMLDNVLHGRTFLEVLWMMFDRGAKGQKQ